VTNLQTSQAPTFNRESHDMPLTEVPADQHGGHGRRNLILGLAAAAVTALAIGGVQLDRSSNSPSAVTPVSPLAARVQVMDAYAPGGSVFEQQVPAAAQQDLAAYDSGGSVYRQQVPAVAQQDLSAYAPGGSVYNLQVPQQ
jgi:hypothetical protein